MFSKYFQAELSFLREMGQEFGRAHPNLAGLLAERGGDPDAERLIEGVAFLTARIRERSEAAMPELLQGLVEVLMPQYLRPVPACSILEFSPQVRALRGPLQVPKGTQVASTPIDGTACAFRTVSDVTLLPLTLTETVLEYPSSSGPVLRAVFQGTEAAIGELRRLGRLRFFLQGEPSVTSLLLLWLQRFCRGVEIRSGDSREGPVKLGAEEIRAVGYTADDALLPWPPLLPQAFRLLQEFFTLPQKFSFFELGGLGRLPALKERFELVFQFADPPVLTGKVARDVLRLYCVPVINLFSAPSEPLRVAGVEQEQLLRPAGLDIGQVEVFSVDAVTALGNHRDERESFQSFASFTHFPSGSFYRLRRALSPIDGGLDTYLTLGTLRDVTPDWQEQTLSCELTCTNRTLPARLGLGELTVPTRTSPTLAKFSNLVPVSQSVRPPLGNELQWRLLSQFALSRVSLAGIDELRALLGLYNFQSEVDRPQARANALRIQGIRRLEASRQVFSLQGASVLGQRTLVELDESNFAGAGDVFLFGQVLDHLFAAQLGLNSVHELLVQTYPSKMEVRWTPRSGSQPLL